MAKRNFIITVVLMLLIVASTSFAADRYQWKLDSVENDCQIYTRHKSLKKMMKEVKKHKYIESAKTTKYNKTVEASIKAGCGKIVTPPQYISSVLL